MAMSKVKRREIASSGSAARRFGVTVAVNPSHISYVPSGQAVERMNGNGVVTVRALGISFGD